MPKTSRYRLAALAVLVAAAVVVGIVLPVRQYLEALLGWLRGRGEFWGLVILALAYTPAALLLFPASALTLGAGAIFGFVESVVAISLGSTLAACVAFLVGRTLARRWVEEKIAGSPRFRALDRAVAERGFLIVLLTRLSPLFPYGILNYTYSLTRVSFRDFALASWVGMLPGTLMYVYLGRGATRLTVLLADLFSGRGIKDPVEALFFFLGLAATVVVTVLVTRIARNALRAELDKPGHTEKTANHEKHEKHEKKNKGENNI